MSTVKATRRSTKDHNLRLVLKTFYENEEISRAEVSRVTGLAKATVTDLVNELVEQKLISESRYGESFVGKPPLLLKIASNGRHLICVDLANQEFKGAVVNLRGEFLYTTSIQREGRVGQEAIDLVCQLLDALISRADQPILGIGIGAPGLIDTTCGFIQYTVNLQWQDVHLGDYLTSRYHLPVYIANDSHVAALAESHFTQSPSNKSLVVIKLGHGIGSGIILNGQLYQGDSFGAGEIGHIRVSENGYRCQCGNIGCLETIATSRAIILRAQTLAQTWGSSLLHNVSMESINLHHIHQAYQAGDPLAVEIVETSAQALGRVIAYLIGILNIQTIILSGDMTILGENWLTMIRAYACQSTLPTLFAMTEIKFSSLGEDDILQGASALLLARELGLSPMPKFEIHQNGAQF